MLTATSFSVEQMPFFNLLTGVMPDQPVTLSNSVSVGGDQREGTAALRVFGKLEVYTTRSSRVPAYVLGADGFQWGNVLLEGTLGGGLATGPLEVGGELIVHGRIKSDGIDYPDMERYVTRYLRELRPGVIALEHGLMIGAAAPDLTHGQAPLQVCADFGKPLLSLQTYAVNWLQFNVRIVDEEPGIGWQGKRLELDFDVDNFTPGTAGKISMRNGRVGLGTIPDIEAKFTELEAHIHRLELQVAVLTRRLLGRR